MNLAAAAVSLALLDEVNTAVNLRGHYRSDLFDAWAPLSEEQWIGDCEDYALEKRKELLAAGAPPKSLRVWVVITESGYAHAVLVADGRWVLDNRSPTVDALKASAYKFRCAVSAWDVEGPRGGCDLGQRTARGFGDFAGVRMR